MTERGEGRAPLRMTERGEGRAPLRMTERGEGRAPPQNDRERGGEGAHLIPSAEVLDWCG